MHCALIMAAGAKARVIISKAFWKRIEMLFHNVLFAIQEVNYYYYYYQPIPKIRILNRKEI